MSPTEKRDHAGSLLMALVWLAFGMLLGGWLVQHYAPRYPKVFCRPLDGGGCEEYPWKP